MTAYEEFKRQCDAEVEAMGRDDEFMVLSRAWMDAANQRKYSYHFEWLGRPIIQYPQDVMAMQEIVWRVQPDLIVETGVAHGGSLILYASLLALLGKGEVVGVDIDIRPHNRQAIEAHPLAERIQLIEGSSIDPQVVSIIRRRTEGRRVIVVLDSNHTHEHVLAELNAYAPLVSENSYCIVMDTVIEDLPVNSFPDRPWSRGNNPKTAVKAFLSRNQSFVVDRSIQDKLAVTVAPEGYLKRVKA
jgi:cephalosporin hydroxylase